MHRLIIILFFFSAVSTANAQSDSIIVNRLNEIAVGLNSHLFVNRYESVEVPCVCIDSANDKMAAIHRDYINSGYRRLFAKSGKIDSLGVACLSRYYSRYAKLQVTNIDTASEKITGTISFTYGYPASSIIQYLGFYSRQPEREDSFYNRLLQSPGWFTMFPEEGKYKLTYGINKGMYDSRDTFSGYVEIVIGGYDSKHSKSFQLLVTNINLYHGDREIPVSVKFASTSFRDEATYYSDMLYHRLIFLNSGFKDKDQAEAIWLNNFFRNQQCWQCQFIYGMAMSKVSFGKKILPNTEPIPPH